MPNRFFAFLILVVGFVSLAATFAQSQDQTAKPAAKPVKLTGCVMPGKEEGCLVLKKGVEYSLHFDPANKPKPGTAVTLEGTRMDVDTCMQGSPIKVTKWTPTTAHCPKPEASQ
ncbi:MAG: hypothetical protein ABSD20_01630 [Terriglobales bacterium]|jgi:hypothetical protein